MMMTLTDMMLVLSILPFWTFAACYRAMLRYDKGL
jgi:hypothetical protein